MQVGLHPDVPPNLVGATASFRLRRECDGDYIEINRRHALVATGPEGVRSECGRDYIQHVPSTLVGAAATPRAIERCDGKINHPAIMLR